MCLQRRPAPAHRRLHAPSPGPAPTASPLAQPLPPSTCTDPPTFPVYSDLERFGKVVKLAAFKPFASAANALENINAVSEAQLSDDLRHFLEVNLPKVGGWAGGQGCVCCRWWSLWGWE